MLAQQDATELLEPSRRIVEGPDDRLSLRNRQRQDAIHPPVRVLEAFRELGIAHEPRELEDKLVTDWHAGKVHGSILHERVFPFRHPRPAHALA